MKAANLKIVLEYLSQNRLMALSTVSNGRPWSATVFFAFDSKGNIYFYSRPDTKHAKHILKNSFVSVAINHYQKKSNVMGLQMVGRVKRVLEKNFKKDYALYRKRFPWADDFKNDHELFMITPTEIHYVDEKRFRHFFRVRMK
mgnify:CR=1 FL=1